MHPNQATKIGCEQNSTARLASQADQGEVLASEATLDAVGMEIEALEKRELELKGKSELVRVGVLKTR